MKSFVQFIFLVALVAVFASCDRSGNEVDPNTTGDLVLKFDHFVGNQPLQLNTTTYKNASGEDFTVRTFNYFVSNIVLTKADGSKYTVPQDSSYFVVFESLPASKRVTLRNIPAADYTDVQFVLGIDSLRNTMDLSKRQGVLDPGNSLFAEHGGMYWSWNSGYIFVKLEGSSPQAPKDPAGNQLFRLHIGGFGGMNSRTINNIKTILLPIGSTPARVRENATPEVHLIVDALKVMNGPTNIRLAENATVMFNPFSVFIANNYVNMFRIDHVHN